MRYPRGVIIVFAKPPIAGVSKTRLGRRIGYRRAATAYRQMLETTLATASGAGLARVQLSCAPDTQQAFFHLCRRRYAVELVRQPTGDLGQRMQRALSTALRHHDYALILGGDCPALDAEHLDQALEALECGEDCVFAPTEDGGYALIGARRAPTALFRGVRWSGPQVMRQTRRRLLRLGLSWARLPRLWDVDTRADWLRARRQHLLD